jgi:multiple sugar transport system permease protein
MSGSVAFLIGTLLTWIGWIALLRGCYLGLQAAFGPKLAGGAGYRPALISLGVGGVALLAATPFKLPGGLAIPLVWVQMPFTAWLAVASACFAAARFIQAWLALNALDTRGLIRAGLIWLGVGACSGIACKVWHSDVQIFSGTIRLTSGTAIGLVALALAAMGAMVVASKWSKGRGWAKATAIHAALIAGSVVFGIPFVWLLVTSFKEDQDMSAKNGIVWVPRVQVTVPFHDPTDPLYETTYKNRQVQGSVEETLPNGHVMFEVSRPFGMVGIRIETERGTLKEIPKDALVVTAPFNKGTVKALVAQNLSDGRERLRILEPSHLKGVEFTTLPSDTNPVMVTGLRTRNYTDALDFLPQEANMGLTYLQNTLIIVVMTLIGTLLSSALVAYGFSRLRFPGKNALFIVLLSTMMLPGAVTMMPTFLIFRELGWIDTLRPLWVPSFFAGAFNVFLLRQFFLNIPMELEDAAKIDGCSYLRTFWQVMLPQVMPALAVVAIWTFMGSWNNFMGPLIYISSPEHMPIAYALQLFQNDRSGEPGLTMAFAAMATVPVLLLFFFAQRYFIEGVQLTGLGGR